jgi:hypothetical protein
LLTLYLTPVVYLALDRLGQRLGRRGQAGTEPARQGLVTLRH